MKVTRFLPESLKMPLRGMTHFIRYIPHLGTHRYCPVCRVRSRRFADYGIVPRRDAKCMYCGALERHRLVWRYFETMTDLFSGCSKKMLHIAPEPFFEVLFMKKLGIDFYLTADLYRSDVMVKADITNIPYPDNTFDVIYCSHVLEHIENDRRALAEFFRVLNSNGWAVLLVPINADRTWEDLSITDPDERLEAYGQHDHVRRCGLDYEDRIKDVGFKVKRVTAGDFLSEEQMSRMAIKKAQGPIFHCTKK